MTLVGAKAGTQVSAPLTMKAITAIIQGFPLYSPPDLSPEAHTLESVAFWYIGGGAQIFRAKGKTVNGLDSGRHGYPSGLPGLEYTTKRKRRLRDFGGFFLRPLAGLGVKLCDKRITIDTAHAIFRERGDDRDFLELLESR